METGAITNYIDVAQLVLYAFWIFFAGVIYYLHRENKREGYPLESDRSGSIKVQGFPAVPPPKTFKLAHGGTYVAPPGNVERRDIKAAPVAGWPGAPLEPSGDPMRDGVGPGSYAERADVPDLTDDGHPMIVPIRVARDYSVATEDADPRGMKVVGADGAVAGEVVDLWIDRAEPQIRYLEVNAGGRNVLLPMTLARVHGRDRRVTVQTIKAAQFAGVPGLRNPDQVTRREEDQITAYYASGVLYADPARMGPLL